jgi:hemerythrin
MMLIIPELHVREEPWRGIVDVGDERGAVKTEILEQHRRLDAMLNEVRGALRAPDAGEPARETFADLCRALETHFEQEDRLYYPSIGALRPDKKARLQACVTAHDTFRSMLRDIAALLERDDDERASQALDVLAQAFERHEAVEEAVLAELDREVARRRP